MPDLDLVMMSILKFSLKLCSFLEVRRNMRLKVNIVAGRDSWKPKEQLYTLIALVMWLPLHGKSVLFCGLEHLGLIFKVALCMVVNF